MAGIGYLAAAVLMLGAAWPITKPAVAAGASPIWFAFGRAALSALCATLVLGAAGRLRLPGRKDLPAILAIGLLQLAAFFVFAHEAVLWVTAGRTAILANTTTIWIVPLSILLLNEPVSARRLGAAGLGLLGAVVLIGPWALDWGDRNVVIGHLLLLGASLSWSLAMVAVRLWPPARTMLELLPWCMGLATLALLPVALLHGIGRWTPAGLTALAAIGLVAGPIGTWCVMQATALLPMVVASTGFLATPATGLLLSVLFLHEALTPDLLLGTGLILCGVLLASVPGRRRVPLA